MMSDYEAELRLENQMQDMEELDREYWDIRKEIADAVYMYGQPLKENPDDEDDTESGFIGMPQTINTILDIFSRYYSRRNI